MFLLVLVFLVRPRVRDMDCHVHIAMAYMCIQWGREGREAVNIAMAYMCIQWGREGREAVNIAMAYMCIQWGREGREAVNYTQ